MATEAIIHQQIDCFKAWVSERLQNDTMVRTLDDLFDEWRIEHPTDEEVAQSVASLRRALDQAEGGEGRPATEFMRDFRERHNLPTKD